MNTIDEAGNQYGMLKVIERAGSASDGHAQWLCACECGNHTIVRGSSLRTRSTQSCGCMQGSNRGNIKASPSKKDLENLDTLSLCKKYNISTTTAWRYRQRADIHDFGPPDPIKSLSETDRAYLAGLIDADGYITIQSTRNTAYPNVGIAQADFQALEWMADRLDATVSHHMRPRAGKNGYHRRQMIVRLHGTRAQLLCEAMLPYLKIKRRQAEIVLRFPCDMRSSRLDEKTNQLRLKLQSQVQTLNARGE